MKSKQKLVTLLFICLVALGGCSRPAVDPPAEDSSIVSSEESESQNQDGKNDEQDHSSSDEEEKEEPEEQDNSEKENEEEKEEDDQSADASQGCYQIFDSGFEVTVSDPFVVSYDEQANNMTITSSEDPSCRGYLFYDSSDQSLAQLEETVKQMEDAYKADPTITDMQKYVDDDQENGLFSFTFTYSAGAAENSPAGFYFIHYQKAQQGVISVNLFTERSSNSDAMMKLIDSIQPATENAQQYGK